jgi:polyketide cyclase/dehydrase/lipid transport protein
MDVVTDIVIDRSADVVAAYASNPDNVPDWYTNIESVEWQSEPPVRVGSRIAFVAHFLGKTLAYTYEVTEFDAMRTAQGPFPMETTYTWQIVGEGKTRMTLRNRGEPAGFSKWVAPFMAMAVRRANQNDLAVLKQRLEGSQS